MACPVWAAHRHRVVDHRRIMIGLFSGASVRAGLITLLPGRIMRAVVFGPSARSLRVRWNRPRFGI
jgi:uncharacterized membrane protein